MVSFTDAHRLPGGILKFLFDKVMKLEKESNEIDIKVSGDIQLSTATTLTEGVWEHGMTPKPDMASVQFVHVQTLEDFSFFIKSIDETSVKYTYTHKGEGLGANVVRILALRDNVKE